jgi:hypothetical protein
VLVQHLRCRIKRSELREIRETIKERCDDMGRKNVAAKMYEKISLVFYRKNGS